MDGLLYFVLVFTKFQSNCFNEDIKTSMILSTQDPTNSHPQPPFNLLLKSIGGCYAGVAITLQMKNKAAA